MTYIPPKAYDNKTFLDSYHARPLRILAEYLEPKARFRDQKVFDTIVFFGSARTCDRQTARRHMQRAKTPGGRRRARQMLALSKYYEDARELARLLTVWSRSLAVDPDRFVVCSGGGPGIMEAANRGAAEAGGRSIGLNISLPHEQFPNPYITRDLSFEFHYFFMRKYWFAYLSKVLVAFPGGFGTLDELMEILTLDQTGVIKKKVLVLVYGRRYWEKIIRFDALERAGAIERKDLELFRFADTPRQAFDLITNWLLTYYRRPFPQWKADGDSKKPTRQR